MKKLKYSLAAFVLVASCVFVGVRPASADGTKYSITFSSTAQINGTTTTDKSEAEAGETVTVTVAPDPGYRLGYVTNYPNFTAPLTQIDDTHYTFTMPAENITVVATYVEASATVNVVVSPNVTVNVENLNAATPEGKYYVGDNIRITATPDSGYHFERFEINGTSYTSNPFTMAVTSYGTINIQAIVAADTPTTYSVSYATMSNGGIVATPLSGSSVTTVNVTITPDAGYELDRFYINGADRTSSVDSDGKTSFTLTSDTILNATFKATATPRSVTIDSAIASYISVDKSSALPGETVNLSVDTLVIRRGSIRVNGVALATDATSFAMPDGDVTIIAAQYDYSLTSVNNLEFADADLQFTFDAPFSGLSKVEVDGTELDASDYEVAEGSTILTLKQSYLATLAAGDYQLALSFSTGRTSLAIFSVKTKSADAPKTAENVGSASAGSSNPNTVDGIGGYLALAAFALAGLATTIFAIRKKRQA